MGKSLKREMISIEGKVLPDTFRRLHWKKVVVNRIKLAKQTRPVDLTWGFCYQADPGQKNMFQIIVQTENVSGFLNEFDKSIMVDSADVFSPYLLFEGLSQPLSILCV